MELRVICLLMVQKELILIKQAHQKNVCFAIVGILRTLVMVYDLDDFMISSSRCRL